MCGHDVRACMQAVRAMQAMQAVQARREYIWPSFNLGNLGEKHEEMLIPRA